MARDALYTRANLVTAIRDEINEPVERIFTSGATTDPDDLDGWIDLGASATSTLAKCEIGREELTWADATGPVYDDTSNAFLDILGVYFYLGDSPAIPYGMQRVQPHVLGNDTVPYSVADQTMKYYSVHWTGTNYRIFTWPGATDYTNDSMYVIGPKRVTTHDSTQLTPEMQFVPFYYAMAHVYAKLGQHRLSALNMSKFIEECNKWRLTRYEPITRMDTLDMLKIPDLTVVRQ